MPPRKVYLIGETHFDLRKTERYTRAFDRFKPDVITIELGETALTKNQVTLESKFFGFQRYNMIRDSFLCAYGAGFDYQQLNPAVGLELIDTANEHAQAMLNQMITANIPEHLRKLQWRDLLSNPELDDIIVLTAIGSENVEKLIKSGISVYDAFRAGIIAKTQEDDEKVLEACYILDCLYLTHNEDHKDEEDAADCFNRDTAMLDKIMQQEGVVVHCGGIHHIYGKYENLYERLAKEQVDTQRFMLIDFHADSPFDSAAYKLILRDTLLERLKAMHAAKKKE